MLAGVIGGVVGAAAVVVLLTAAPGSFARLRAATSSQTSAEPSRTAPMAAEELSLLTGKASISGSSFSADIYNGTDHRVSAIEVVVSVPGRFANRRLVAVSAYGLRPLAGGSFFVDHGDGYIGESPPVTWNIVGATVAGE